MSRLSLLVFLLTLAPALELAGEAPPPVAIALQLHVGDQFVFDSDSSIKQTVRVTQDSQPARRVELAMEQHRQGTMEILAVEEGIASAVRVSFAKDCRDSGGPDADKGVRPFALAGQTLVVRRDQSGHVSTDLPEPLDERTMEELGRFVQPDRSVYPTKPVTVGQSWDARPADLARQFKLGSDDRAEVKCTLSAFGSLEQRKTADIAIDGLIVRIEQGFVRTSLTVRGSSRLDLATGEPLNSDVTAAIKVDGSRQSDGPDGPVKTQVDGDGTLEAHLRIRFAPPPAAVAAPRDAFAGDFADEAVMVALHRKADGTYDGALKMKDQTFPLQASLDKGELFGSFDSQGTRFSFRAQPEDQGLLLSSEGSQHHLKRKPEHKP